MKISNSFFKTSKSSSSEKLTDSYGLLLRGGFLKQISAGRFALLPLGFKVYNKVIKIIEDEMNSIGAERMELPVLQPIEIWKVTNRDKAFGDQMFIVEDHFGKTFVMSATGEALMTELFGSFKPSYKDLPINVYQFLLKFRDETRPRGGMIRAREFLMKDAYNFEKDEESFMKTYNSYKDAYTRIFNKVGLESIPVLADNGALGGDYSHEFMVVTPEKIQPLDIYWEEDEAQREKEIVSCVKNEQKLKEILKNYQLTPEKTLKNMIYKVDEKYFVCVVIRGDYKIDFTKLRRVLAYQHIRPASSSEIEELGSYIGYVSAIGLDSKVKLIVDESVKYNKNYFDGAHKDKVFSINVNFDRDYKVSEYVDIREDKSFSAGGDKIVMCDRCDYKANVEKAEFVREEVNMDEEMKPFDIITQPEWVCTMDDNIEHYKKPKSHFMKNVVYKNKDGKIIIASIRGDLEANPTKISNILNCGPLEMADDEDLSLINTKSGWVHSWGHDKNFENVIYIADEALKISRNMIGGQKEKETDSFNVNYGRDFEHKYIGDICNATEGSKCKYCKEGYLHEQKAIEVGHIFKYDSYYSTPHKAYFMDKDGTEKPMLMGAYGIGVGRLMSTIAEMSHDEKGIIWPECVAPYKVLLIDLGKSEEIKNKANEIYNLLKTNDIEILWDDRDDVSAGVKFADADLIGIPYRVVVSERSLKEGGVEIKKRDEEEGKIVKMEEVVEVISNN